MFERYTPQARAVVIRAQVEARELKHNYIGTEHFLLALLYDQDTIAARALRQLDVNAPAVRHEVKSIIGVGHQTPEGHIPFTPRAKKMLELALREAVKLGNNYIGDEHLLLAVIREGEGVAVQSLLALGVNPNKARSAVIELLTGRVTVEAPSKELGSATAAIAGAVSTFELLERLHKIAVELGGISLSEAADKVLTVFETATPD